MAATDKMTQYELDALRQWGRRTIFYLLFYRDTPEFIAMGGEQRRILAMTDSESRITAIWNQTELECANSPSLFEYLFSRSVIREVVKIGI